MDKEESIIDTIKTIVYAVIIAVAIRTFLFEPFRIPSGSMYPSLYVGDYLFVSKYTYGYSRHSLPFSMPLIKGRIFASRPQYGDVVVFKFPQDNRTDFIKRIIGLPGDKIKVSKGRLSINDEVIKRQPLEDFVHRDEFGNAKRFHQYMETLPNGVAHKIIEVSDDEKFDNTDEVVVPADSYFVMGDNRDASDDSRASVGFVPAENLVGQARFLFYSHRPEGAWYLPWEWPRKVRWERLFKGIE